MKPKLIYSVYAVLFFVALWFVFSCSKDESTPKYSLKGKLTNTTFRPVKDAVVKLFVNNESNPKYTAKSDDQGNYEFGSIKKGLYTLVVAAEGYSEEKSTTELEVSENTTEDASVLGDANVTGIIVNSQTGGGLSSATVSFTLDHAASTGTNAELQVTTNVNGYFTIENGPTGSFNEIVEAEGFFPRVIENVTFSEGENDVPQQTVVEQPDEGTLRIILTWGSSPYDLDTHFTGPQSDGSRFHIYYVNKTATGVNLDVDDTYSYGPETVTITSFVSGTYRYSVYNYSNKTSSGASEIAASPAQVEVYNHTGLLKTFLAPSGGDGNTWRVFDMTVSGTNANISTINTYVTASTSSDASSFKSNRKNAKYIDAEW
jgi:hypothetical protein